MRFAAVLASSATLVLLSGCGGTPSATNPVRNPLERSVAGRWSISSNSLPTSASPETLLPGALFNGALQQSGSTVTGAGQLTVIPALLQQGCPIFQTANLHGTFSASRHLSLTSDPLDGDVLQLELDVPADPHAGTTGTLAIAGPCALAKTTAISLLFEPLTGTYTGMVQAFDPASPAVMGAKLPATVTVSETDPDATGVSTVSGTAHVTLASCTANLPFQFRRAGGLQSFDPQTAGIAPPVPSVVVAGAPLATTLGLTVAVQPDCSPGALLPLGTEYLGTLTRQ